MPAPMVALPCGSRSTSNTLRFMAARLAARFTLVVVFPTPPFWLAMAMILVKARPFPRSPDDACLRCRAPAIQAQRQPDARTRAAAALHGGRRLSWQRAARRE